MQSRDTYNTCCLYKGHLVNSKTLTALGKNGNTHPRHQDVWITLLHQMTTNKGKRTREKKKKQVKPDKRRRTREK